MSNAAVDRTPFSRTASLGRVPASPVTCTWAEKPSGCFLCTWAPAPRQPDRVMLKLVHAGCLEHLGLDTVAA